MTVTAMCSEVDTMCAELRTQTMIGLIGNRDAMEGINDRRPLVLRIIMAIGKIIWKILKFLGKLLLAIPKFIIKIIARLVMSKTIPGVTTSDMDYMNQMLFATERNVRDCQRSKACNYDYDDLLRSITDSRDNEDWIDRAMDKMAKLAENANVLREQVLTDDINFGKIASGEMPRNPAITTDYKYDGARVKCMQMHIKTIEKRSAKLQRIMERARKFNEEMSHDNSPLVAKRAEALNKFCALVQDVITIDSTVAKHPVHIANQLIRMQNLNDTEKPVTVDLDTNSAQQAVDNTTKVLLATMEKAVDMSDNPFAYNIDMTKVSTERIEDFKSNARNAKAMAMKNIQAVERAAEKFPDHDEIQAKKVECLSKINAIIAKYDAILDYEPQAGQNPEEDANAQLEENKKKLDRYGLMTEAAAEKDLKEMRAYNERRKNLPLIANASAARADDQRWRNIYGKWSVYLKMSPEELIKSSVNMAGLPDDHGIDGVTLNQLVPDVIHYATEMQKIIEEWDAANAEAENDYDSSFESDYNIAVHNNVEGMQHNRNTLWQKLIKTGGGTRIIGIPDDLPVSLIEAVQGDVEIARSHSATIRNIWLREVDERIKTARSPAVRQDYESLKRVMSRDVTFLEKELPQFWQEFKTVMDGQTKDSETINEVKAKMITFLNGVDFLKEAIDDAEDDLEGLHESYVVHDMTDPNELARYKEKVRVWKEKIQPMMNATDAEHNELIQLAGSQTRVEAIAGSVAKHASKYKEYMRWYSPKRTRKSFEMWDKWLAGCQNDINNAGD